MKTVNIAIALILCCGSLRAHQDPPAHVRVCVQYISLPQTTLTELLADESNSESSLHQKAFSLTKNGNAKLIDSNLIICRSGEQATVESVLEYIYPTEYDGPCAVMTPEGVENPIIPSPNFRPSDIAYETRNMGVTLEIEPTLRSDDKSIDLRLVPEMIHLLGLETWVEYTDTWGKADIKRPIFETWRSQLSLHLKSGKFMLATVITPKQKLPAPFLDARILLFVRADVIKSPQINSP